MMFDILHYFQNACMQQPLCHLYFLTVMEHLESQNEDQHNEDKHNKIPSLVNFASDLQKQLETSEDGNAILLWLELQAVIQTLLQQLAMNLDSSQPSNLGNFILLEDDINKLVHCSLWLVQVCDIDVTYSGLGERNDNSL